MDADIASTLSGFALGEVFSSLDLDASALGAVQSQLGIRGNAALNRDAIYAEKFADDGDDGLLDDDDVDDLDDEREDFEAMIDREMREERDGIVAGKGATTAAGNKAAANGRAALMRGEEDDFDEEYDEPDEDQPMADAEPRVKEEPVDHLGLDGSAPPAESSLPSTQQEAAPAPAQLSLQLENLAPPPSRQVDVKELFPSFEPGKTLAFTDLFAMRPRKKRRVVSEGVKREHVSCGLATQTRQN